MGPSTPALVIASFALGWYAAYVLVGKRATNLTERPVEEDTRLVKENATLKQQNTALRKEVDELSRRIIETAFVQDEEEMEEAQVLPKPLHRQRVLSPPSTPPLH